MNAHRQSFFKFPLDPFQEEACQAIDAGENVLVCAPTGAGKTAVAEWAMMAAVSAGKRCLYTTPLKALSNQKFFDLCQMFGERQVGLSTGDISIRGKADLVVMTTEVYRNMLYGTSPDLDDAPTVARVASVILDECHYMNDEERGTVWEESIIYTPREIQMVGLSATVANAREMKQWLDAIHGPTRLICTDFRPVPLRHFYFRKGDLMDIFAKKGTDKRQVNPRLLRGKDERPPRRKGGVPFGRSLCNPRELLLKLERQDMLPVIYFVFSRKGCEQLLEETLGALTLTDSERSAIDAAVVARASGSPEILEHPHLDYLRRGVAVHHAGVLPLWKSLVEQLFTLGLVKAVFATETLAAGINMPARTTVISALSKFTGEGLRPLTGSEMLQMSGRAGRRGMDQAGNVVVCAHPKEPVEMVVHLARAKPEALESHFQPSYGMVLNLLQRRHIDAVKELLDRSFGQFLHQRQSARTGPEPESSERPSYWEDFQALAAVLTDAGLLENSVPTAEGRLMAHLRASNIFAVGEALLGPVAEYLEDLTVPNFAAICCLLVSETVRRDPRLPAPPPVSRSTATHLKRLLLLFEELEDQQLDFGVERALPTETLYCGVAELWGTGISWEALEANCGLDGGDLFRVLRRTYDLCRQVENWLGAPADLVDLARRTGQVLLRGPLEENLTFFELQEGDLEGGTESALEPLQELPSLRPLRPSGGEPGPEEESNSGRRRVLRRRKPVGVRGKSEAPWKKKPGRRGRA